MSDMIWLELRFTSTPLCHSGLMVHEVKAPLDDFREVRFYRRGRHTEQFQVAEWFGLRKRKVELVQRRV